MKAIIQHLRFPFSLLLLPVFTFALSENNFSTNLLAFPVFILLFILHLLVYPSSNAYNSLQDADEGSIGLIENPLPVPKILGIITIVLDLCAIMLCLFFEKKFDIIFLLASYIVASRLYSYRKIRLKKYAITGFLTVFIFQGLCIFMITELVVGYTIHYLLAIASSFLIGSMYPLSQIYQHQQDADDGVKSLSILLGYRGTFIFSALMFAIGSCIILFTYWQDNRMNAILTFVISTLPILLYFLYWFYNVFQQTKKANYKNTMYMNIVSCVCLNICFLIILIFKF
jgi:1,4-dihydroxy-2-naphthoate polyprenyltransferase